jgi:tetratricopeptide (TPR) repeat protein
VAELLAGRPEAAEARLRRGYGRLEEMGEKALLAGTAAMLARVLHGQGRLEEASEVCGVSEEAAAEDDVAAQAGWRGVRAMLLAGQGRHEEAQRLAAEAVGLAAGTDFPAVHAEALTHLAVALAQGGRTQEAGAALRGAVGLHRRKGDVVSARAASARLRTGDDDQRTEAGHAAIRDHDAR